MINWGDVIQRANYGNPPPSRRLEKSDEEWQEILSAEKFAILRQKRTEPASSGEYCALFTPGEYQCAGCRSTLFTAESKFHSSAGWPSFGQPIEDNLIAFTIDDDGLGRRVAAHCNICDGHLGHVFPDGPHPHGLRFCINSLALEKVGNGR